MKKKSDFWVYFSGLLLGLVFVIWGLIMIIKNLYGSGISRRFMSYTATGGELFVFIGIIFLIFSYFSISPFSKFRKFIEGPLRKKKSKSKNT